MDQIKFRSQNLAISCKKEPQENKDPLFLFTKQEDNSYKQTDISQENINTIIGLLWLDEDVLLVLDDQQNIVNVNTDNTKLLPKEKSHDTTI